MQHFLKILLLGTLVIVSLAACKKTQEESAEAAKATITEMKANTIDAAKAAAADAERAAKDIAAAAENAGAEAVIPSEETKDK
jgi:hypothetical protein